MRKFSVVLLLSIILGLALALGKEAAPVSAQASSAAEVVAAVNDFRTASGLPALQVHPILMTIAQAQSDYQASIGTVTHTGPGGTGVKDRAYAAGFGGGATIFVSENIAAGYHLSIQSAINQYWQDQLHLSTMLNPASVYIGAGVAVSGDKVYYTVDVGYYAGAVPGKSTPLPKDPDATAAPTAVAYDPFVISTPREDGAIIHVVGYGQSLIGIAKTYEVELDDVLQLNGLSLNEIIYPGDKIVIKQGVPQTPTPTSAGTAEEVTNTPRAVAAASKKTPTPRHTFTPLPSASLTPTTPIPISAERQQLVIGVVVMALLVFLAVIATSFLKR